jgi:hypothetical protein
MYSVHSQQRAFRKTCYEINVFSGITFIRYAKNRQIGKLNNSKVFGARIVKTLVLTVITLYRNISIINVSFKPCHYQDISRCILCKNKEEKKETHNAFFNILF